MEVKRHTNRNIKHSGQYTFETMQVFPVMGVYNTPPIPPFSIHFPPPSLRPSGSDSFSRLAWTYLLEYTNIEYTNTIWKCSKNMFWKSLFLHLKNITDT